MKKRVSKNPMHVRIEDDVAREVRARRVANGRTVQGEVNITLRVAYASAKWSIDHGVLSPPIDQAAYWNKRDRATVEGRR